MRRYNLQEELQNILLGKGYHDEISDWIEFHADDMDYFTQIAQDFPLKGKRSIRKKNKEL